MTTAHQHRIIKTHEWVTDDYGNTIDIDVAGIIMVLHFFEQGWG
jgi:hypothetical protein